MLTCHQRLSIVGQVWEAFVQNVFTFWLKPESFLCSAFHWLYNFFFFFLCCWKKEDTCGGKFNLAKILWKVVSAYNFQLALYAALKQNNESLTTDSSNGTLHSLLSDRWLLCIRQHVSTFSEFYFA